jgi:hypothetical protein
LDGGGEGGAGEEEVEAAVGFLPGDSRWVDGSGKVGFAEAHVSESRHGAPALLLGGDWGGVEGGAELGDAAVVDLEGVGGAFEDDVGGGGGTGEDAEALGGGEGAGADGDGDFGGGEAVVADVDDDEIASGAAGAGEHGARDDVGDGEVGEAAIVVDPVVEEPGEIGAGGVFEGFFEDGLVVVEGGGEREGVAEGGEGAAKGLFAEDVAELPEDRGGFEVEVDVGFGVGEGGSGQGWGWTRVWGWAGVRG